MIHNFFLPPFIHPPSVMLKASKCYYSSVPAHLAGEVVMQKHLGGALVQLAHPGGLLQLLREDLVELHPAPLCHLPLDLGRGLLVADQQGALELALVQLVELLQEDAAFQKLLGTNSTIFR